MGIAPFTITYDRRKVIDFTEIYAEEPRILLIPLPMEDSRLLAFTKPFQSVVWLGLCLLMILVPLILWLITDIFDRKRKRHDQHRSLNYTKFVEKFQPVFAVLVSQREYYKIFRLFET